MIKRYALLGFVLIFILALSSLPKIPDSPFNLKKLGSLPVLHEGRLKPLNSALTSIVMMGREKQYVKSEDNKIVPIEWFLTLITDPETAHSIPFFLIDHPQVKGVINHAKSKKKVFSLNDIRHRIVTIYNQAEHALQVDAHQRNSFQRDIIQLQQKIDVYSGLQASLLPSPIPEYMADLNQFQAVIPDVLPLLSEGHPSKDLSPDQHQKLNTFIQLFQSYKRIEDQAIIRWIPPVHHTDNASLWVSTGEHILHQIKEKQPIHSLVPSLARLLDAYKNNDHQAFNSVLNSIDRTAIYGTPLLRRVQTEHYFVLSQPFFLALILYLAGMLLLFLSYIRFPIFFQMIVSYCLKSAFFLHTVGLGLRLYISGRPPVTNLYSSAVFVGWVAIILAFLLEKRFKNTIGLLAASIIGFITLIIAHHLSFQGDTMAMMQAVLDSNFWLSTHVITVTMGYGGTFLAGFLALIFILMGVYTSRLTLSLRKQLYSMVFGVACFSLLFSFVGTVLGGIWADQSWGRFWGWDPKENGALLIVLFLAIMLHARIGGFIKEKGFMVLAVFGNIVTSFSWFGVNMLGIGLHSYGFMDSAFMGLTVFILSQLLVMGLGMLPDRYWRS